MGLRCWPARGWAGTDRPGRPGSSISYMMGRGPAQPITFSKIHCLAWPGPSFFPKSRLGPAQQMVARPMRHGLYMDRPENYVGLSVDLTDRPMGWSMCCPVLEGACAYADVIV